MTRARGVWLIVSVCVAASVYWIASHTYWVDTKVPMPPKGEALVNPFYAAQRFVEALGAHATRDHALVIPPNSSVIVLSGWHWSLSRGGRDALKRWVESGGRLIVDRTVVDDGDFERWSGIAHEYREPDRPKDVEAPQGGDICDQFNEAHDGTHYWLCGSGGFSSLTTTKSAEWALTNESGIQAMRVRVDRGSVTSINASPFRRRNVFQGDHGALFVAATQLRRGDDIHFLSEDDHPSLLALLWKRGAPVVMLALVLVALMLWRGGVRLGPIAEPLHAARRSLAEQIRGTGQFALRHGSGDSLHAACVRALDEAAARRANGYARMPGKERIAALERLTGFDRKALAAAIRPRDIRNSHDLRRTIALLEAARRQLLIEHSRPSHGTS